MSNLFWLSEAQMERLQPHFPKSHGKPRVDDRRVLNGIIFVIRNGLRWCDAPAAYALTRHSTAGGNGGAAGAPGGAGGNGGGKGGKGGLILLI